MIKTTLSLFLGIYLLTGCSSDPSKNTPLIAGPDIINGFTLPAAPDESLNNSTPSGIDSNDNGVRDDLERALILKIDTLPISSKKYLTKTYLEEAKLKGYLLTLENPTDQDIFNSSNDYLESPYVRCLPFSESIDHETTLFMNTFVNDNLFNTEERIRVASEYQTRLDKDKLAKLISSKVYSREGYFAEKKECKLLYEENK